MKEQDKKEIVKRLNDLLKSHPLTITRLYENQLIGILNYILQKDCNAIEKEDLVIVGELTPSLIKRDLIKFKEGPGEIIG